MAQTPSLKTKLLQIGGMDCGGCAKTIEASLQKLSGIESASVSFATGRLNISYDPDRVSEAEIYDRIQFLGYTIEASREVQLHQQTQSGNCKSNDCCKGDRLSQSVVHPNLEGGDADEVAVKTLRARVIGMDCGSCAKTIEVGMQQMPGVFDVSVNFATERLQLSYNPQSVSEQKVYDQIKALGYTVEKTFETRDLEDNSSCHRAELASKPIQKSEQASWRFWIANRRGQSVLMAAAGIVFGLLAQHLELPIWIARAFYGIGKVSPKSQ